MFNKNLLLLAPSPNSCWLMAMGLNSEKHNEPLPCHSLEREATVHMLAVVTWQAIQAQGQKRQQNSSWASIQDSLQTVKETNSS